MKLLALTIYKWEEGKCTEVSSHYDLASFSFFHRGTIREHIKFHSRTIAQRSPGRGLRNARLASTMQQWFDVALHSL